MKFFACGSTVTNGNKILKNTAHQEKLMRELSHGDGYIALETVTAATRRPALSSNYA
jgi:hypothetical protein